MRNHLKSQSSLLFAVLFFSIGMLPQAAWSTVFDVSGYRRFSKKLSDYYGPLFEKQFNAKLTFVEPDHWPPDQEKAGWRSMQVGFRIYGIGGQLEWGKPVDIRVPFGSEFIQLPSSSLDGALALVCWNMGLFLAGPPPWKDPEEIGGSTKSFFPASSYLQTTFYSTAKCLKIILSSEDNVSYIKNLNVDPIVERKCGESFRSKEDIALCIRSAYAFENVMRSLFEANYYIGAPCFFMTARRDDGTKNICLMPGDWKAKFSTPSRDVVSHTVDTPFAFGRTYSQRTYSRFQSEVQCMLDTAFAGATCAQSNAELHEHGVNKDSFVGCKKPACGFAVK